MVDHDRLFKQLLSTFFVEFLELFAPELARELDPTSVEFLEKESFTDALAGTHHIVDLLARVRMRAGAGYVLVHVENQADAHEIQAFPRRMFRYFAGIEGRHPDVPIYPVALLSYERPRAPCPDRFDIALPGLDVLRFRFRAVQLNALDWRDYLRHPNPVAAALMSRMRIRRAERTRVKLECLCLLAGLHLDPGKTCFIASFIETYLNLDREESKLFERELEAMPADQRQEVLEFTTSWHEEGRAEGRRQEAAAIVLRQLRRRLPELPEPMAARIDALPVDRLESLADDLLDFTTVADVQRWLARLR